MPVFDFQFDVDAPQAVVAELHRDTSALKKLTPPPTIVQLRKVEPLGEGSVSEFTLWVGVLPLRWKAVHQDVGPGGFTDVLEEGPAKSWKHTHSFVALDEDSTRIEEHIEYEHKRGFWGVVTRILFSKINLYLMFTYRKIATRIWLKRLVRAH